jgi:hypothetical protein
MNLAKQQKGAVEGDFAASITLYHAYELLLQHGMRAFYNFMMKSIGEGEGVNRSEKEKHIFLCWSKLNFFSSGGCVSNFSACRCGARSKES